MDLERFSTAHARTYSEWPQSAQRTQNRKEKIKLLIRANEHLRACDLQFLILLSAFFALFNADF
jgi:hypothetical protein